jgi:hypothetical protein
MAMTRKRRILIAAVAVVGILCFWWMREEPATSRVHRIHFGQTMDEVIAIMGPPTRDHGIFYHFGPKHLSARIRDAILPYKGLVNMSALYPVTIRFDQHGRVDGINCSSEGIFKYREPMQR